MSLFGEQLEARLENDKKAVARNEQLLGAALSGRRASFADANVSAGSVAQQMQLIARYFHLEQPKIDARGHDADEIIEEAVRATNMGRRSVRLTGAWWKDGDGPLLARTRDGGGAIALFPGVLSGLYFTDAATGKKTRVTKANASMFDEDALCFYQPLPARPMTGGEYYLFLLSQIKPGDLVLYFIASILLSVGGIVATMAVKIAFDLGYTIAGFDVLGDRGATYSADEIETAAQNIRPGSIVIYHMNQPKKATFDGVSRVIPKLKAQGWRFAKLENYL